MREAESTADSDFPVEWVESCALLKFLSPLFREQLDLHTLNVPGMQGHCTALFKAYMWDKDVLVFSEHVHISVENDS